MRKFLVAAVAILGAMTVGSGPSEAGAARRTRYVMSSPLRAPTDIALTVNFAVSPFAWRYGYWGGSGWSDGGASTDFSRNGPTADLMDVLFRTHDLAYLDAKGAKQKKADADAALLSGLLSLPKTNHPVWGKIYQSEPDGAPIGQVLVQKTVLWHWMPFSEYARRQAILGFLVKIAFQ